MVAQALDTRAPGSVSDLDNLAKQINAAHAAVHTALLTSVERAVEAGQLLAQAKEQVPHGQWEAWVAESTAVSSRTARGYMQAARYWTTADDGKRRALADLGLQKLLAEIAEPQHTHNRMDVDDDGEPATILGVAQVTEEEAEPTRKLWSPPLNAALGTIARLENNTWLHKEGPRRLRTIIQEPVRDNKAQLDNGEVLACTDINVLASLRLIARAHPTLVARASMLDDELRLEGLSALLLDAAARVQADKDNYEGED